MNVNMNGHQMQQQQQHITKSIAELEQSVIQQAQPQQLQQQEQKLIVSSSNSSDNNNCKIAVGSETNLAAVSFRASRRIRTRSGLVLHHYR